MKQDTKAVAYTWAACLAADLWDCLWGIYALSLVIAGLNNLYTAPYLARVVMDGLSMVALKFGKRLGISHFFEDPSRFNRRLEMFIRRCMPQANSE